MRVPNIPFPCAIARRAVVAAAFVGVLVSCSQSNELEIVGTLERHRLELAATVAEPVSELLVRVGDRVAPGAVLVRQDPEAVAARLDSARSRVAELQARLDQARRGPRSESLAEARARLRGAKAQRDRDQREFTRVADLVTKNLVSTSALDTARAARDRSVAHVAELEAQLLALTRGTRTEEITQAEAALAAAKASLHSEELSDRRLIVRAPVAGIIEALPYRVGERPPPGAPVAIMLEAAAPFARVYVPETRKVAMIPGARVVVLVDGVAAPLSGTVRYLAAEASFTPYFALTQRDRGRLVYLCEIDLDPKAVPDLPVGVPVTVSGIVSEP